MISALALCATARRLPVIDTSSNASRLLRDRPDLLTIHIEILSTSIVWKADDEPKDDRDKTDNELWCSYFKRSLGSMKAMLMDDNEVRRELGWGVIQSPWDGDMRQDLEAWGYDDSHQGHQDHDYDCNFTNKGRYKLEHVSRDLSTDPRSAGQGGPNHRFYVQHKEGPAMLRDKNSYLPLNSWDQRYRVGPNEYIVRQRSQTRHCCYFADRFHFR